MSSFTKTIAPALALLGLWVSSVREAHADLIYDSGAPGFIGGAAISAGDTTAGFFTLGSAATLTEVKFVSLDQPVVSSTLDWFVSADVGGTPGPIVASGTATPTKTSLDVSLDSFTYFVNDFSVAGPALAPGDYFLGLNDVTDSSQISGQFPRNWAENTPVGRNPAAQRVGTGPWQAFPHSGVSFQLFGSPATLTTPEPSTLMYVGMAAATALGGCWLRRREKEASA